MLTMSQETFWIQKLDCPGKALITISSPLMSKLLWFVWANTSVDPAKAISLYRRRQREMPHSHMIFQTFGIILSLLVVMSFGGLLILRSQRSCKE